MVRGGELGGFTPLLARPTQCTRKLRTSRTNPAASCAAARSPQVERRHPVDTFDVDRRRRPGVHAGPTHHRRHPEPGRQRRRRRVRVRHVEQHPGVLLPRSSGRVPRAVRPDAHRGRSGSLPGRRPRRRARRRAHGAADRSIGAGTPRGAPGSSTDRAPAGAAWGCRARGVWRSRPRVPDPPPGRRGAPTHGLGRSPIAHSGAPAPPGRRWRSCGRPDGPSRAATTNGRCLGRGPGRARGGAR